ncbi:hypothetical protein U1Q18_049966, partial [Sarracenia purpurea var. burkii]
KSVKNDVTLRDTFHRSDPSPNKETMAIYVTQNSPPSLGQVNTEGNNAYWTSDNNVEMSNSNTWPTQSDIGDSMQRNPQIPPPDTNSNGDSFGGYSYTTIPSPPMDNNAPSYTQYYPSITESPREYAYPPYYPPSDLANGYNAPVYGYPGNNIVNVVHLLNHSVTSVVFLRIMVNLAIHRRNQQHICTRTPIQLPVSSYFHVIRISTFYYFLAVRLDIDDHHHYAKTDDYRMDANDYSSTDNDQHTPFF